MAYFFYKAGVSGRTLAEIHERGLFAGNEDHNFRNRLLSGKDGSWTYESLVKKGLRFIFYPCVTYENQEFNDAGNHYNCQTVNSYPEVICNNMDHLRERGIIFKNPFLNLDDRKSATSNLYLNLKEFGLTKKAIEEDLESAGVIQHERHRIGRVALPY